MPVGHGLGNLPRIIEESAEEMTGRQARAKNPAIFPVI
jgi:hypothetical protein